MNDWSKGSGVLELTSVRIERSAVMQTLNQGRKYLDTAISPITMYTIQFRDTYSETQNVKPPLTQTRQVPIN